MNYIPIVGLEIHVELKTKSKMFCSCSASHFQVAPNTHTCPVCLGLPGALPVANKKAIEWCQLIGLALNCKLAKFSKFDRKNYFYPDLPKGYQISQYDQPFCKNGFVNLKNGKKIGITRVHMEEDTAKNVHKNNQTLVDFNRSSVPLVEIVTEPDFRSKEDIDEFLKYLRQVIRYPNVSDADMEKGSMRLELNMSLKNIPSREGQTDSPVGEESRGVFSLPKYKVEIKNINSFRYLQKAFDYELIRQAEILDRGELPKQETRGYQEDVDRTISQRSKEDANDYRYFPEPDIPPFIFTDNNFKALKLSLPELPNEKNLRFTKDYNLTENLSDFLTETKDLADYFEKALDLGKKAYITPLEIANVIKNKKFDWQQLSTQDLIANLNEGKKDMTSDESTLLALVQSIIDQNPKIVADYKSGKTQVLGFLVGLVMRQTKGKADAKMVNEILTEKLKS